MISEGPITAVLSHLENPDLRRARLVSRRWNRCVACEYKTPEGWAAYVLCKKVVVHGTIEEVGEILEGGWVENIRGVLDLKQGKGKYKKWRQLNLHHIDLALKNASDSACAEFVRSLPKALLSDLFLQFPTKAEEEVAVKCSELLKTAAFSNLSFNFPSARLADEHCINLLSPSISVTRVRNFTLSITHNYLTSSGCIAIIRSIGKAPFIDRFKLDFSKNTLGPSGGVIFVEIPKACARAEVASLSLNETSLTTVRTGEASAWSVCGLKMLEIAVADCAIHDCDVVEIIRGVKELKHLETFRFSVRGNSGVGDTSLDAVGLLASCAHLTELSLDFSRTSVTNLLRLVLPPRTKNLTLDLSQTQIRAGLSPCITALTQTLSCLSSFSISLKSCLLTDASVLFLPHLLKAPLDRLAVDLEWNSLSHKCVVKLLAAVEASEVPEKRVNTARNEMHTFLN
eukprot:TRINITY_DN24429_c0_g1_i1.p1 TRINITY_DN24429_c0_g1~~TRINITY_DN24429_c0_g1_i1.p1  ORF type:complete len:464 (+),score=78.80 TRINITY_DN24429_c0_g1_i1:27-1394(+)